MAQATQMEAPPREPQSSTRRTMYDLSAGAGASDSTGGRCGLYAASADSIQKKRNHGVVPTMMESLTGAGASPVGSPRRIEGRTRDISQSPCIRNYLHHAVSDSMYGRKPRHALLCAQNRILTPSLIAPGVPPHPRLE